MKTLVFATGALASALMLSPILVSAADDSPPSPATSVKTDAPPVPEPTLASKTFVSPWVNQVLKLVQAGVDEPVILAFIDSAGAFSVTSDQVVSLREEGVSSAVLSAMIAHDTQIRAGVLPMPSPPAGDALPAIKKLPPLQQSPVKPVTEPQSIVNPSPAPETFELASAEFNDIKDCTACTASPQSVEVSRSPAAQPVREPQPVPLTDTIRVFRAAWKTPNIQILQLLPP